jgi:hypothetical protein
MLFATRITLGPALLMALLFGVSTALAQAPTPNNLSDLHEGFRGIRWGQTIEEIQQKSVTFGTFEAQGKSINVPVTGGTQLDVNNIPIKLAFTFIDKKFAGVVMVPADAKRMPELVAFYIQQFGAPVYLDQVKQRHAWQDPKVTIMVQEANKAVTFIVMNNESYVKAGLPVQNFGGLGGGAKPAAPAKGKKP